MARKAKAATMAERVAVLETEIAAVMSRLEANSAVLADINGKLSKQKGFIAGVIFVVTALWGVVAMAVKYLPIKP